MTPTHCSGLAPTRRWSFVPCFHASGVFVQSLKDLPPYVKNMVCLWASFIEFPSTLPACAPLCPRIKSTHIIREAVQLLSYMSSLTGALVPILAVCLAIAGFFVLFAKSYSVFAFVVEVVVSASALAISGLALFAKSFAPINSLQAISVTFLAAFIVNVPHTLLGIGLIEGLPLALRTAIEVLLSGIMLTGIILMLRSCNMRISPTITISWLL